MKRLKTISEEIEKPQMNTLKTTNVLNEKPQNEEMENPQMKKLKIHKYMKKLKKDECRVPAGAAPTAPSATSSAPSNKRPGVAQVPRRPRRATGDDQQNETRHPPRKSLYSIK